MSCVVCNNKIADAHAFLEMRCGMHLAHSFHQIVRCPHPNCATAAATPVKGQVLPTASRQPPAARDEIALRRALSAERAKEPLCPPQIESSTGMKLVSGFMRTVTRLSETFKPDSESSDPFTLLAARVPLVDIRDKHGMDITEMINDYGVTINDFFKHGYALGDMCDAFSSRMNTQEGMDVLYFLGIGSEHFRVCPELVQPQVIRTKLGYVPQHLLQLGFQFDSNFRWTIPEMVRVGLTMPILMEAGLTLAADWAQIKATATLPGQLTEFGVTRALEAQLVAPAVQLQQQPQPQPQRLPFVQVTETRQQQQQPQQQQPQRIMVPGVTVSRDELEATRRSVTSAAAATTAAAAATASKYNGPRLVTPAAQSPFQIMLVPRNGY